MLANKKIEMCSPLLGSGEEKKKVRRRRYVTVRGAPIKYKKRKGLLMCFSDFADDG